MRGPACPVPSLLCPQILGQPVAALQAVVDYAQRQGVTGEPSPRQHSLSSGVTCGGCTGEAGGVEGRRAGWCFAGWKWRQIPGRRLEARRGLVRACWLVLSALLSRQAAARSPVTSMHNTAGMARMLCRKWPCKIATKPHTVLRKNMCGSVCPPASTPSPPPPSGATSTSVGARILSCLC